MTLQTSMDQLLRDLRFTLRGLRASRTFFLAAVASIAIGTGAVTTVFSIANRLLLSSLPVPDPGRLFHITERREGNAESGAEGTRMAFERYRAYRAGAGAAFSGLAAQRFQGMSLRADADAFSVNGVLASANYFDVLGVRPALGRFFTRDDEPVVVISDALWRTRFGARADVVGRTVYLDSQPFQVAGVAPAWFAGTFPAQAAEIWLPAQAYHSNEAGGLGVAPFGRLRAGTAQASAGALIQLLSQRIPPEANSRVLSARLEPMTAVPGDARQIEIGFLAILFAAATLVLLIAAVNLAGMLLARASARRREIALRLALGASRARIVRQLLTETLLVYLVGGGLGVGVCYLLTDLLARYRPPLEQHITLAFGPDLRVLTFAFLLSLTTGTIFGLAPALRAARGDASGALKGEDERGGARSRARLAFVAAQLALSVVLLVSAGLFVRTLLHATQVRLGFEPAGVVTASIDLEPHGYSEARARQFYRSLTEQVGALPGVESVGLARFTLLGLSSAVTGVKPADSPDSASMSAGFDVVDPGYFRTLRVPIVAGRALAETDVTGAPNVAVVNERFARQMWPGRSPIGQRFRMQDRVVEVVGVAADGKYEFVAEPPRSFMFFPVAQQYSPNMVLNVRVHGSPGPVLARLRTLIRALDPNVAIETGTLERTIGISLFPQRLAAIFIGALGLIGLALAALGVYAILAYYVARRTREFGIRIALGARPGDIATLVLRRGALVAATGCAAGLLGAAAVTRVLAGFLFGVGPLDPFTFLGVPALLAIVALFASYLPARRATRVDPLASLRAE